MKDNTLRTEWIEALADLFNAGRLQGGEAVSPEKWHREINMAEERLLSAIKNRLPKERDAGSKALYNQAIREVKHALNIGSES